MKLDPCLSVITKINTEWIEDFHVLSPTPKLLEESIGTFQDSGTSKDFLERTLIPQKMTPRAKKQDYMTLTSLYTRSSTE